MIILDPALPANFCSIEFAIGQRKYLQPTCTNIFVHSSSAKIEASYQIISTCTFTVQRLNIHKYTV